jgi:hypothetical protein
MLVSSPALPSPPPQQILLKMTQGARELILTKTADVNECTCKCKYLYLYSLKVRDIVFIQPKHTSEVPPRYTQKNGAVSRVSKKMYFSPYTDTMYTVSSENFLSFSCATNSSYLLLTVGPRDQFPRWRRRRRLSVCSVLKWPVL